MLADSVCSDMRNVMEKADAVTKLTPVLKAVKTKAADGASFDETMAVLKSASETLTKRMHSLKSAGALSDTERKSIKTCVSYYEDMISACNAAACENGSGVFNIAGGIYEKKVASLKEDALNTGERLSNMIRFVREAYKEGNEPVILAARLTTDMWSSRFIGAFGSSDYEELAREMEVSERGTELKERILKLDI